jgi:serine/threonine-protein kinase
VEDLIFGRRYRVLEKIGTGGMADVYKAVDEVLGRTVAVKVMHARYATDPSFAARFRHEAQSAANLVSPNIVNMYDWGADGDTYYIVMEYVRGSDLKSIILDKGALPSAKVADIGAQICSALSVAHGYDIIHRDIKPHNIMVQPDGSVKVMDFGIARATNSTLTQTGSVLGTAHYVSPEQAQGKELQATSDLYSLGIVLYEASTGRVPFDADTPVAVALKQVNEQPRPPRAINPNIDPHLEAVIVKAMQKNPAVRYGSAAEMRQDLLAVANGRVPAGAPLGAAAAGAAGAATIAAGADHTSVLPTVGAANSGAYRAPDRRTPAPPKKKPIWPWVLVVVALLLAGLGVAYAMNGGFADKGAGVPDITGMSQATATVELEKDGFVVGQTTTEFSETVDSGKITTQTPPPGTIVPKGTQVSFSVSKGAAPVAVPKVIGLKDTAAVAALQSAGFVPVAGGSQYDSKAPAGQVLTQSPAPGTRALKGSQVSYVVSMGIQLTPIPDVSGQSKSSATSTLEKAGFKVSYTYDFSDGVASGDVISQAPSTGGSYPPKTVVTLTISEGKGVTVPNCVDNIWADAKTLLEAKGLKISPNTDTSGTVVSQDPSSGTTVKKGTTIHLSF